MPRLVGAVTFCGRADDYTATLLKLASDSHTRADLGCRAQESINAFHVGSGWHAQLEQTYERILTLGIDTECVVPPDTQHFGMPDKAVLDAFQEVVSTTDTALASRLGMLPLRDRIRAWRSLREVRPTPSMLLPWPARRRLALLKRQSRGLLAAKDGTN